MGFDHRTYNRNRYRRLKKAIVEKLGGCCVRCRTQERLEVDHIDRTKKLFDSHKYLSVSLDSLWLEIEKCQLLCRPCHLEKTLKESGRLSARGTHGTLSAYRYCRCDRCRKAKAIWMKAYHTRRHRIRIRTRLS